MYGSRPAAVRKERRREETLRGEMFPTLHPGSKWIMQVLHYGRRCKCKSVLITELSLHSLRHLLTLHSLKKSISNLSELDVHCSVKDIALWLPIFHKCFKKYKEKLLGMYFCHCHKSIMVRHILSFLIKISQTVIALLNFYSAFIMYHKYLLQHQVNLYRT